MSLWAILTANENKIERFLLPLCADMSLCHDRRADRDWEAYSTRSLNHWSWFASSFFLANITRQNCELYIYRSLWLVPCENGLKTSDTP